MLQFRAAFVRWLQILHQRRKNAPFFLLACLLTPMPFTDKAIAGKLTVVASLRPLHGIIAAVMAGAGRPKLLLTHRMDPHHASLRPSQARLLEKADVIFIVSRDLERFLKRPLAVLANDRDVVELAHVSGIHLLTRRRLDPPDVKKMAGTAQATTDWHVWTDPLAAAAMAKAAAEIMARKDTMHAALYRKNAELLRQRLQILAMSLKKRLKPFASRPFIVTHDAFQYFDARFGLTPLAAIQPDDETLPGPQRMTAIIRLAQRHPGLCVLHGPGHDKRWAQLLEQEAHVRSVMVDVLGYDIRQAGSAFLERYYEGLGWAHVRCLKKDS